LCGTQSELITKVAMPPKRKSDQQTAIETKKAKDELPIGLKWENVGQPDSGSYF
jgi:hypothetical protein